jgi:hypothetical protein
LPEELVEDKLLPAVEVELVDTDVQYRASLLELTRQPKLL